MLAWIARGLHKRRVTTRYPKTAEPAPRGFHGEVVVREPKATGALASLCPTGAITVSDRVIHLDRGRCILCGDCVRGAPDHFAWSERSETATRARPAVVADERGQAAELRALRRSIHIRHIDCGSDGSEEWEIQALWNPYYDIQRLGFFLTASPRHADILLVTGAVTHPMRAALQRTWEVMPSPKALVAVGAEACSGALTGASGLTAGGVAEVLPVDVLVPGSPPPPIAILHGLLLAVGRVEESSR